MDRLIRKRKSLEKSSDDVIKSLHQIKEREEEKEEKYQSPAKSDFMDKCNLNWMLVWLQIIQKIRNLLWPNQKILKFIFEAQKSHYFPKLAGNKNLK